MTLKDVSRGSVFAALAATAAFAMACGDDKPKSTAGEKPVAAEQAESAKPAGNGTTIFAKDLEGGTGELPATDVKLPGGGSVSFKDGETLKIAYVGFGQGFDYTKPNYAAAEETAKALGADIDTFDPAADPQKQVAQLQDIMNGGKYNAVVAYAIAPDLTCDLLSKQLPAKNILVAVHTQSGCAGEDAPPGILTTVLDTGARAGYAEWAQKIAAEQEAGAKAIVLTGPEVDTTANVAVEEIEKAFDGKIEIASLQRTDYSTPDSLKRAQDAMQANADATVLVSTYPEGARGLVSAAKAAGKSADVKIYDFGGAEKSIKELGEGIVAASTPMFPHTVAKATIEAVVLARQGKTVPEIVENAGVDGLPDNATPWLTKADAAGFKPEF